MAIIFEICNCKIITWLNLSSQVIKKKKKKSNPKNKKQQKNKQQKNENKNKKTPQMLQTLNFNKVFYLSER